MRGRLLYQSKKGFQICMMHVVSGIVDSGKADL